MHQQRINILMTPGKLGTVCLSDTVRTAADRMMTSGLDVLAVADPDGRLAGVVDQTSVVRALISCSDPDVSLDRIVIRHCDSVLQDATLASVIPLFRMACHAAVPVVDSELRICGLLQRRHVLQSMLLGRVDAPHTESLSGTSGTVPRGAAIIGLPDHVPAANGPISPPTLPHPGMPTVLSDAVHLPNDGQLQRPHFLSGIAARERLRATDARET